MIEPGTRTRIFDFFLLLLIFFSVVSLAQRIGSFGAEANEAVSDFSVQVLWENVDSQTVDCLAEGEPLRTENGELFGTVTSIQREPHEVVLRQEGQEIRKIMPAGTTEDVYLTVLVSGRKPEQTLLLENGTALLRGQTLRLYSLRTLVTGTVISA